MSDNEIINRDLFDFQQTERSAEEIADIIVLCKKNSIDYSPNSFVWSRTKEEIEDILRICRENNINLLEENYLSKNGYIINADIFKFSPEDVQSIISFCDNNNISYINNLFSFNSIEEIQDGFTLCQKIDVDFSCFRGEEVADAYRINIDGIEYVLDKTGKKIITVYGAEGEVTIPSFVEEICEKAFLDCEGLKKISIPGSVKKIGEAAFKGCTGLLNVEFSQNCSLEEIANSTFEDCEFLHEFNWPNNIKIIGEAAFKNTAIGDRRRRDTLFVIPDTVEIIRESAFENCTNIERLVCPSSLRKAKRRSFAGCTGLKYIGISPGTYEFDDTLFSCDELDLSYCGWSVRRVKSGQKIGFSNLDERARNIQMFCKSGLELYSYYKENPQELPKRNNVNPLAIQQTPEDYLSYVYGDSSITNIEALFAKELSEIIVLCSDKSLYDKVLSRLNVETFVKNANFLINKLGVKREKISELIVSGNHYNMLGISIDAAFNNYQYLCEQKLVSESILQKLYFGSDDIENKPKKPLENDEEKLEDYRNKLKDYYNKLLKDYYARYNELPELFNSLLIEHNDKNMLELRDRLTYVSTMHLLDSNFNYIQLENAKDKLKYSLLENIVNRDKAMFIDSNIYSVLDEKYPEMCGIMYSLREKLTGIDEQWFPALLKEIKKGGSDTTFDKFYKSLTVIQHWNEYGETERLTLLKNEIVGRLLYSDIALAYKRNDASANKFVNKRRSNSQSMHSLLKYSSKSRDELFTMESEVSVVRNGREISEKIPPKINFILTMLELDPYSFDALRNFPNEQSKSDCLQSVFAAFANKSGYLFGKKEIDEYLYLINEDSQKRFLEGFNDYNSFSTQFPEGISTTLRNRLLARNDQKTFSEFMSNVICNARIPKEMESKYLDYVRELSASFLSSKSDDELFKFCGALDLYLRSKSEYDIQSADEGKTCAAVEVFDRKSNVSSDARILYSLHNLNRLAHDAVEIDLKSILDQRYRLDRAKANDSYKKLTRILTAYNDLFHMGFSYETVLHLAKKDSDEIWAGLEEYIEDEDKKKTLTGQIKELSDKRNANMNEGTFDAMVDFSLTKSKVQLAFNNARMFLEDNLSVRRRKSLATFNYELDDKSKKVDFEKLRTIKKKLSIIRDTFNSDGSSNLTDEERELIETTAKPKSYFFESKKLFAQEIMNRISMGFSDNFSSMLGATYVDKLNFYANNGYIAEIQDDEHGNPVLVCLCEQFNEPFGIHLQDLPKSVSSQLAKCERTRTIAYAMLDRRGLTLRDSAFATNMSNMYSPCNFVGFRNYDKLLNAIKSNYDSYDVPAKKIREDMARQSSRSELDGMFSDGANNASGANINTGGNKHQ